MNMRLNNLNLKVPETIPGFTPKLTWNIQDIRKWSARLPMSKPNICTKQIHLALIELNYINLQTQERFDITEVFRPLTQWACFNLRKHFLNKSLALTDDELTMANLALTMQKNLTYSYKHVVEDLYKVGMPGLEKGILPTSIYRIMHYERLILLRIYQLYESPPEGVWHEINLLYQFAEKIQAEREVILESNSFYDKSHTIHAAYKKTLLLAALQLNHWRQNEQEMLRNVIYQWEPLAIFRVLSVSETREPGKYIIDLAKDSPPIALIDYHEELTPTCLILDLKKLINHIKDLIAEIEENEITAKMKNKTNPEYNIDLPTLKRLLILWGHDKSRSKQSFKNKGSIGMIFSLTKIHDFILRQEGEPIISILESSDKKYEKIIWKSDNYPPLQAGELVGINSCNEEENAWEVGIVRYLQRTNEGNLSLGVDKIGTHFEGVELQVIKNEKPTDYTLKGLAVSSTQCDQCAYLITPTIPFEVGKKISIHWQDGTNNSIITLNDKIDATSLFKIFACPLSKKITPAISKKAITSSSPSITVPVKTIHSTLTNSDLDKIWNKIG